MKLKFSCKCGALFYTLESLEFHKKVYHRGDHRGESDGAKKGTRSSL
jgi:hypothetical protein